MRNKSAKYLTKKPCIELRSIELDSPDLWNIWYQNSIVKGNAVFMAKLRSLRTLITLRNMETER